MDSNTIFGAALARYRGAIDAPMYAWYPPESLTGSTHPESQIYRNYLAHAARHAAGLDLDIKRTFYLSEWVNASGATAAQYAADINAQIQAPGWLHYRDRPVIGLFTDTLMNTNLAIWTAFRALLPSNIYLVVLGSANPTELTNVGANTYVSYGPLGSSLSPNGQHPWADQFAANQADWGSSGGRDIGLSFTFAGDQRARRADPQGSVTAYADAPTVVQGMHAVSQASRRLLWGIYATTEPTEGGPGMLWGTTQRGSRMADAIKFARLPVGSTSRPSAYVDRIDTNSLNFTRSGTTDWSRTELAGAAVAGAFDSDLRYLTAVTDTLTASFDYATRIEVLGPRGGASGFCSFTVDGGSPTVVDTNSGSGQLQAVFDSGALAEGTHTLVIAGDAANAGLSRRCATDVVYVTQNIQSVPYTVPD